MILVETVDVAEIAEIESVEVAELLMVDDGDSDVQRAKALRFAYLGVEGRHDFLA